MSWNIISPIDTEIYGLVQQIAVDNLTALRAISSSTKNRLIALRGLDTINDGSGGFWIWNFGTAIDDPPITVRPNDYATAGANQGYWSKLS